MPLVRPQVHRQLVPALFALPMTDNHIMLLLWLGGLCVVFAVLGVVAQWCVIHSENRCVRAVDRFCKWLNV